MTNLSSSANVSSSS